MWSQDHGRYALSRASDVEQENWQIHVLQVAWRRVNRAAHALGSGAIAEGCFEAQAIFSGTKAVSA